MIGNFSGETSSLRNPTRKMESGNDASQSQEKTSKKSTGYWPVGESKIITDARFVSPYHLEHGSLTYRRIVPNFHHYNETTGDHFIPFRPVKKALLHAIRLQVINGKTIRKYLEIFAKNKIDITF